MGASLASVVASMGVYPLAGIMLVEPASTRSQLLQSRGRVHNTLPIALRLATAMLNVPPQFFFSSAHEQSTICRHAGLASLGEVARTQKPVVHSVVRSRRSLPVR